MSTAGVKHVIDKFEEIGGDDSLRDIKRSLFEPHHRHFITDLFDEQGYKITIDEAVDRFNTYF